VSASPAEAGEGRFDVSEPASPAGSFIRAFPCKACGAKVSFAPGTRELRCENRPLENMEAAFDAIVAAMWLRPLSERN